MPKPNINFEKLASLNSARPQTSYGGISERKRSLQKNMRQQSSKLCDRISSNDNNFVVGNIFTNNLKNNNLLVSKLSEINTNINNVN